jgi:spermidine/putrescine-binding protein
MSLLLALVLTVAACGTTPATPAPTQPDQAASATDDSAARPDDQTPSDKEGSLVLLEWASYEAPEFHQPFVEKHPKVTPEYSFFAEDAEAFTKLQSGFEVDLVHPCNGWWGLYVEEGLVQPIDTSKLANWQGVDPKLAAMGQFDGKQYFVPWDWGYESILVRTDKVKTIPQSWADLTNPEYAGHLALWDSGESNQIIAALALGFDPWNTTPEQDEQIEQWLTDLKPNLLTYWADFAELAQSVASGDVWVASNVWADTYSSLLDEGVPVEYIEPKEGKLGFVCGFGISSAVQDPELAYAYIDAALAPESMAAFSNTFGYGSANRDALPLIDPATVERFKLDDIAALEKAVFYRPLTAEQRERFTSMWNAVKAAP